MNKNTFIKLLTDPASVSQEEMDSLDAVLKNFPYCNAATILLAKGNNDKGSMFSHQKIKKAAAFAPSRETLRQIILSKPLADLSAPALSAIEIPVTVAQIDVVPEAVPAIDIAEEVQHTLEELKVSEKNFEITQTAVDFDEVNGNSLLNFAQAENQINLEIAVETEASLRYYVHLPVFGKNLRRSKYDLITEYLSHRPASVEKPAPEIQAEIIQKFIEESPSISRFENLSTDLPKVDLSRKSTEGDTDLVTETFANILIKQSKFKKAIEVYQKLILKNPDKSDYFAEKINYVNSLII